MKYQQSERSVSLQTGESLLEGHQNMFLMKDYEPPKTKRVEVKAEGNFCGSIISDGSGESTVSTEHHEVQTIFENSSGQPVGGEGSDPFDFTNDNWD